MLFLAYLNFLALVSYLYLAVYLFAQKPRKPINRCCIGFLLCLALWSLPHTMSNHPGSTEATARFWMNISAPGWLAMGHFFLGFVLHYAGKLSVQKARWFHLFLPVLWIPLTILQWRGQIIDIFIRTPYGWSYGYASTFWTWLTVAYISGTFSLSLYLLYRFTSTRKRRIERFQGLRLFHLTLISVVLATCLNIILPLIKMTLLPPLGNVTALIWAGWLIYTLVTFKSLAITPVTAADSILATMGDMLFLCDPEGIIVTANQAVCDHIGGLRDQIEGQPVSRFIEPSQETPDAATKVTLRGRIINSRMRVRTLEDRSLPVILSSSPILDRYGESAGSVIVAKDIGSMVATEKALRQSEQRYRDLVENLNDVIYAVDTKGVITYISPRIQDLIGYSPGELLGTSIADVVCAEDRERLIKHYKRVLDNAASSAEGRMLKKTGGIIWVSASGRPIAEAGEIKGIQGVITDIHQRVEAQNEKTLLEARLHKAQKMEAIGTLAGGVAHDLNNILGGIVSYPELLMMELPEESPMREALGLIKSSGQKAVTIVQDLLTMARRSVVQMEVLDINALIDDFLSSPEHRKQRHYHPAAALHCELADDLPPVKGSRVHLTKTLMNLVSNALEALPSGDGSITVATSKRCLHGQEEGLAGPPPGNYAVLEVRDTGIGIDETDRERIFEPFFTKKGLGRSGTGLGMAVVWGTVQDHGGHIEVSSAPGKGTRVTIYLPATDEVPCEPAAPVPLEALRGDGETILVVDDIETQRRIASEILTKLGYRVLTAESGREALEVIKIRPVTLLLLDMIMEPGWDGLTTYQEVLKVNPHQKAIIASGFSETVRVRRALQLGACAYLKKPYSLTEVGQALRRALSSQSPQE
jgi:PAS domain S-box-containing protein